MDARGTQLHYLASGCIRTAQGELANRIKTILDGLAAVIAEFAPQQVVVEQVFVNINPQSTLLLGQARGAALCAAVHARLPVAEYTALQVKQAIVGKGHAEKMQVQEMVKRLLSLSARPASDAADALACAICHAHSSQGVGALLAAGMTVRAGRLVRRRASGGRRWTELP